MFFTSMLIFFTACEKNNKEIKCDTCKTQIEKNVFIDINGESTQFSKYLTNSDIGFYSYSIQSQENTLNLISAFHFDKKPTHINSFFLLSDKHPIGQKLNLKSVYSIIIYEKINDDFYNVKVYACENQYCTNICNFNYKTTFISTNEIISIDNKFFYGNILQDLYAFINYSTIKSNSHFSELDSKLYTATVGMKPKGSGGATCNLPCKQPAENMMCTASEHETGYESWFCIPIPKGPICDLKDMIASLQEKASNYDNLVDVLHTFRDSYLALYDTSNYYKNLYYTLSSHLGVSEFSYFQIDLILSYLLDIKTQFELLLYYPTSDVVFPINTTVKNKLLDILEISLSICKSSEDSSSINLIKNKVIQFENKSSSYISNNL